ncbi:hypothetical protein [Kitasatospora aureofaciens]|uniref:hypothetical protein n=1 Tax=Kitasatospora aureofaciens TaxID=1894 RepID=UPI0034064750
MNDIAAITFGIFMIVSGAAHFLFPAYMRRLIPSWMTGLLSPLLGRVEFLVVASGVADIVVGGLILVPQARAVGGWAAAGLVMTYLVCHVDALTRSFNDHPRRLGGPTVRLAVNLGYIAWAIAIGWTAA